MLAFLVKYPRLLSSHALPSPIQCFAFSPPVLCLLSSYASPSPLLCFARAKF